MTRPTPIVDAAHWYCGEMDAEVVDVDIARSLERRLAVAVETLKYFQAEGSQVAQAALREIDAEKERKP